MSNLDIIRKLEEIIDMQTRNGRTDIYVHTDDLEKLGLPAFDNKGMVTIELDKLEMLMEKYKRNVVKHISDRQNEDDWEK